MFMKALNLSVACKLKLFVNSQSEIQGGYSSFPGLRKGNQVQFSKGRELGTGVIFKCKRSEKYGKEAFCFKLTLDWYFINFLKLFNIGFVNIKNTKYKAKKYIYRFLQLKNK